MGALLMRSYVSQTLGGSLDTIGDAFRQTLLDTLYERVVDMIAEKFSDQGRVLTRRERTRLLDHIRLHSDEPLQLHSWRWWERDDVSIEISDRDIADITDAFDDFLNEKLGDMMLSLLETLSEGLTADLRGKWKAESRRLSRHKRAFKKRLDDLWGEGFERLEMCLVIARELGDDTRQRVVDDPVLSGRVLPHVLIRLHARSCQIADEVLCLLRDGFADGAMARWRTMHEIAVVAFFLSEYGDDAARRYVDHEVVESYRAAVDYRSCSERLGYDPMDDIEFAEIKTARDGMVQLYGQPFGGQYGWAADALGILRPSFRDIERATGIDHLRAHYRMASHNVHANPKGVFFRLGLLDDSDVLLAGASNAGMCDPGHSAGISLMHATVALCLVSSTMDTLVGLKIMMRLVDEIGVCLGAASDELNGSVG